MSVEKYHCPTCGSYVTNNTSSINTHNKTQKHLRGFDATQHRNTDEVRALKLQRMREYRAKKKAELGDAEYKNQMKKEKQKYRLELNKTNTSVNEDVDELKVNLDEMKSPSELSLEKSKKAKAVLNAIELKASDNFEQVVHKIVKASNRTVSEITAKVNLKRVGNIYKYMTGKQWDYVNVEFLQNFNTVVDSINTKYKDKSPKTRSNQFVSIAAFLKFFPQYSELYKKYSKLGVDIVEQLDKKTKDNTLSEKQMGRLNWKQVKALWYKLGDDNGGNSFLRALYAIYTFIPVRRVMDYQMLKIVRRDKMSNKQIENLDKKYNYLFLNKSRRPISMTIWNYKSGAKNKWSRNNKDSGQYELNPIPEKLANVLQEYIIDEDIKANEFLFGLDNNHSKPYSTNAFSSLVSNNLFEVFSGQKMGVNDLRSSYASWYLEEAKTLNEKEELAFRMGSSVHELEKSYYKVELTQHHK